MLNALSIVTTRAFIAGCFWLSMTHCAVAETLNPAIRISNIPGPSIQPNIAAYGGTLHAVWVEYPNAGSDSEIYYSRSSDNGNTWSAPVDLSNNSSRPDILPIVAAGPNGGVHVFWTNDVVTGQIFHKGSTDGGLSFAAEQQLSATTGYNRPGSALVDGAGRVHLTWYGNGGGGAGQIFHRLSCDNGTTWTATQNASQFDVGSDQEAPRLAAAPDGTIYMLFRGSRDGFPQGGWPPFDQYLLRSTSISCSGVTWLYPAQKISRGLPETLGNTYGGSIFAGASGKLHIAYWDEEAGNNLTYRGGNPLVRGFDAPVLNVSALGLNHPESDGTIAEITGFGLGEDDQGAVHLAFGDITGVREGFNIGSVRYAVSPDNGTTWGTPIVLSTTQTMEPRAILHQGRLHIIWSDFRDNNFGAEIYYRSVNVGSTAPTEVDHYYQAILNRPADVGGKAFWEEEALRTQSLGIDVKETYYVLAGYFFNSSEYLNRNSTDTQYVTDLYNTFFNRPPDSGGLSYWLGQLSSGLPRNVVLYSFLFSTEFNTFMTGVFGNTTTRAEIYAVVDFYRGILNRLPDTSGFNYWLGQFRTAQCQGSAAVNQAVDSISSQFINGSEYINRNRTNSEYVQDMYYAFLRRGGDLAGVNYWINQLNTGALTRNQVRQQFIQSPEFQNRVTQVINQGCLQ